MTGGTEGPKDIFDQQVAAGISTLVGMHFSEEALEKCKSAKLNVIVAGHIASDTLGLNLLLDQIEKEAGEELEVTGVSGFERIKHL
jgi:putative NIF3 family GTP cyclohydrolase 1 type 2